LRFLLVNLSLGLSIFFAASLLLTDAELWAVAPDHAYALLVLMLLDCIMLLLVLRRKGFAIRFTQYWGAFKALLFLADILTAPQYGLTYLEFATYLFSLWAYNGLLLSQILITASGLNYMRSVKKAEV